MKKKLLKLIFLITAFIIIIAILNIKVNTNQGINYSVSTLKIPLYLKVLDFFDRHYNYKWAVHRIIDDAKTDEEKVLKIFKWTCDNIKKAPDGYPVIDDHVWHIMVRGYGVVDQFSDVFTTLCNYANVDAFYNKIFTKDQSSCIFLSFTKIDKRWVVFDPYNGVYFKNNKDELASIEEILTGNWLIENIDSSDISHIDYNSYLSNLRQIRNTGLSRANIQSPLNRLKYEIKKWVR